MLCMAADRHELVGPFMDLPAFRAYLRKSAGNVWKDISGKVNRSFDKSDEVIFSHGDLNFGNIMDQNGRRSGLIDWECIAWTPEHWDHTAAMYPRDYADIPFKALMDEAMGKDYSDDIEAQPILSSLSFGIPL